MKLDEIKVGGVDAKTYAMIKDCLYELKRDGLGIIELFEPFHKHIKVKEAFQGEPNLINVIFKTPDPRAAGSMSFAGTGKSQDELDYEQLQTKAAAVADELLHHLGNKIKIEDYSIEKRRNAVVLFMVSDGFTG